MKQQITNNNRKINTRLCFFCEIWNTASICQAELQGLWVSARAQASQHAALLIDKRLRSVRLPPAPPPPGGVEGPLTFQTKGGSWSSGCACLHFACKIALVSGIKRVNSLTNTRLWGITLLMDIKSDGCIWMEGDISTQECHPKIGHWSTSWESSIWQRSMHQREEQPLPNSSFSKATIKGCISIKKKAASWLQMVISLYPGAWRLTSLIAFNFASGP